MSIAFFISPFKPPQWSGKTDFEIEPSELGRRIQEQWPDIEISYEPKIEYYLLWWEHRQGSIYSIMGGLQAGKRVISLEGSMPNIVEFTLWYRDLIPNKYKLFFFDSGLHTIIELTVGTTREELLKKIGVA